MQQSSQPTLVFTLALNGYQWLYRSYIRTHARYAQRHGYQHQVISRPRFTAMGVECCWLKLEIIRRALQGGYQRVLFIDADARVSEDAPAIDGLLNARHSLYMAKGYSGEFNSGVILAQRHPSAIAFLTRVLASRNHPLIAGDGVGWGENGHIIHHARGQSFIGELDRRWNNTQDPLLADYIRHFNHGPLRSNLLLRLTHKCLSRLSAVVGKCRSDREESLACLVRQASIHYPELFAAFSK